MKTATCPCTGNTLGKLLKPAVMALLSRAPLHGYVLVQRLGEMKMLRGQAPDPAGVYRLLKSLEADGYVQSAWDASDAGPKKRQFVLTAAGRKCLDCWTVTLGNYAAAITDLLATVKRLQQAGTRKGRR